MSTSRRRIRKEIVAIIPARAGSKGLPDKNIYPILGHPMIAWSIRAAIDCPQITHTFVISDGSNIRTVAEHYGARIIPEPTKLGAEGVSYRPVLEYAVTYVQKLGINPDIIVYLQPTSPQRDADDISHALELLNNPKNQAIVSVYESDNKFLKSFLMNKKNLRFISDKPWPFMIRAILPKTYMSNGAIYAVRAEVYHKRKELFAPRTVPYIMPVERSVDIDFLPQLQQAVTQMKLDRRRMLFTPYPIAKNMRRPGVVHANTRARRAKRH